MEVNITFENGDTMTIDCLKFSVNPQVRLLCIVNHHGGVHNYNIDKIKDFTVPVSEVQFS